MERSGGHGKVPRWYTIGNGKVCGFTDVFFPKNTDTQEYCWFAYEFT